MSKLPVIVAPRVYSELDEIQSWWAINRSADQATRWLRDIEAAINDLSTNYSHQAVAAENRRFPFELRQLNFGLGRQPSHRILFTIRPECVYILAVRHVSQQQLGPDDLA